MVEDSQLDHDLLLATLRREGLPVATAMRVESIAQLTHALASSDWDAVISDHRLPGFSSLDALSLVRAAMPHCPFIIVSGVMGEDAAVDAPQFDELHEKLEDELGDLLFSCVNLCRKVGVHASLALDRANRKFADRFTQVEKLAGERGLAMDGMSLAELDALWDEVKMR